jgi:hypothetical protein
MRPWRKVVSAAIESSFWALNLECGHVAYRSAQYSRRELPTKALCAGCEVLIGTSVKSLLGKQGAVAGYNNGRFKVRWNDHDLNHWTLDELREKVEIY